MLGVVTQATDANLSTGPVSAGTTAYDGDLLPTDQDGALTVRAPNSMLYLGRQSRMFLRSLPGQTHGTAAHLSAGTLAFSAAHSAALEVFAGEARIQPAADASTVGQVTVIGPKMLYIYARHGALVFSYREESQVVADGQSYRVLLDPDDDSTNKLGDTPPAANTNRRRRPFLFLLLGAAAALGSVISHMGDVESPDHP
jgi:hypothetical protein